EDCPADPADTAATRLVINVIAEQATVEGRSDNPGYLPGYGAVPASILRAKAATATLRPVALPQPCAEAGYRPSAALTRFIRCRDLTCRFPGCDAPAAVCQIDHTIPYPAGPTHPSNLKLLCVFHHQMAVVHSKRGFRCGVPASVTRPHRRSCCRRPSTRGL